MSTNAAYRIETIETARPPRDVNEGRWCRYVLSNDQSRVVGRFRGTLKQTRRNAEQLVRKLNDRSRSKKSPWALRSRKRSAGKSKT